jgi:ankyrin repeat protein
MAADINLPLNEDMSPLHFAVMSKSINIVRFLLERFAEVNPMSSSGKTPLHISCEMGL